MAGVERAGNIHLLPKGGTLHGATSELLTKIGGKKAPKEKEVKYQIRELVRQAIEDRYDAAAIYELFAPAAKIRIDTKSSPAQKSAAKDIMDGISAYFEKQEVVVKSFVPLEAVDDSFSALSFSRILDEFPIHQLSQGLRRASIQPNEFWQDFFHKITEISMQRNKVAAQAVFVSKRAFLETPAVKEIIKGIMEIKPSTMKEAQTTIVSDTILKQVQEESQNKPRPDIFTARFGGTTLEELINEPFGNNYVKKVLQYVASMPKGNLIWQQVAHYLFFEQRSLNGVDSASLSFPKHAQKVVAFQMTLASELLGPSLAAEEGQHRQPAYDKLIQQALNNIYPFFYDKLTNMLFRTAQDMPQLMRLLSAANIDVSTLYPFDRPTSGQEKDSPRVVTARIIKSLPEIQADWMSRFGTSDQNANPTQQARQRRNIKALTTNIEQCVTSEYAQFYASSDTVGYFMQLSRERRYQHLIDSVYEQQVYAEQLLPQHALQELSLQPHMRYNFHSVKIQAENPLSAFLGYQTITLSIPQTPGQPVIFGLLGKTKEETLSGVLAYDGTLQHVFTEATENQRVLLQSVIAETYRQILQQTKQTDHPSLKRPVADFEPKQLSPEEVAGTITPDETKNVMGDAFEFEEE